MFPLQPSLCLTPLAEGDLPSVSVWGMWPSVGIVLGGASGSNLWYKKPGWMVL